MTIESSPENPLKKKRTEQTRNWLDLPREVTLTILSKVGSIDILTSIQKVCMSWRNICKDQSLWRSIDMGNCGYLDGTNCNLAVMCRQAVDRSCGGLNYINIEYFGNDDLIRYIAERASGLKGLRLACCCDNISEDALSDAMPRFPLLEDLEISYCVFTGDVLTTIGRSCPLLKSFKYNCRGFRYPHIEYDEEAVNIAENMPQLRYLQLFGNKLTDNGLYAIIDGCQNLEYLDLRQCFNVRMEGDLKKLCGRIKVLRYPNDSTNDYEFDASIGDSFSYEVGYPSDDDYSN